MHSTMLKDCAKSRWSGLILQRATCLASGKTGEGAGGSASSHASTNRHCRNTRHRQSRICRWPGN